MKDFIKEFLRKIGYAFPELFPVSFYASADSEERRGCLVCLLVIIGLLVFCSIIGAVLWWVFG
jgi:hypothetical protein